MSLNVKILVFVALALIVGSPRFCHSADLSSPFVGYQVLFWTQILSNFAFSWLNRVWLHFTVGSCVRFILGTTFVSGRLYYGKEMIFSKCTLRKLPCNDSRIVADPYWVLLLVVIFSIRQTIFAVASESSISRTPEAVSCVRRPPPLSAGRYFDVKILNRFWKSYFVGDEPRSACAD